MASQIQHGPVMQQKFVEEINYDEIQKIRVVGKGAFGVVWQALWRETQVAVKHINSEAERKAFSVEVRQLSRVSHPNIVRLYGACTRGAHVCLVMEFAEGGSLYNVLHCNPKPKYKAAHAMSWARQCAEGVAYLHAMRPKPLIHRDLKPPNLLLVMGGLRLKICDFGTAADKATYMTNNKGSAAWMAPEVFEGSSYTEKCDVFSWGIILWEVLSRRKPFDEVGGSAFRIMWAVHTGQRPPLIENCPPPIENLMIQCWHKTPTERPSMHQVVETMTLLCDYFPGADTPIVYEGSYSEEMLSGESDLGDDTLDYQYSYSETRNPQHQDTGTSTQLSTQSEPIQTLPVMRRTNNQDNRNSSPGEQTNEGYWSNVASSNEGGLGNQAFFNGNTREPSRGGFLAVPDPRLQKPLQIHVEPNAWDFNSGSDEELSECLELRNMPDGFDKLVRPPFKGNTTTQSSAAGANVGSAGDQTGVGEHPPSPGRQNTPPDPALDSMHMMLDPHLRPVTPDLSSEASVKIFEEHKQLAQEYLKVQTELAYLSRFRTELLDQHRDEEVLRQKREAMQLEDEKDSLEKLYWSLKKQLELIGSSPLQLDEDWVLIPEDSPHE